MDLSGRTGSVYVLYAIAMNYMTSDGSDGKESACNVRDLGMIPGSRSSPGEGNGNPVQYSCLENLCGQRSLVGYSP